MPPSTRDYKNELREKDQEIQLQLDRIYRLIEKKSPVPVLQFEYKSAVERITEKYQILLSGIERRKNQMSPADYESTNQALRDEFKEKIVLLALTIDQSLGISPLEAANESTALNP